MAKSTTKYITLKKMPKKKKEYIGTGGDGGLLSDKIRNINKMKSK